jgi:hypothetical protein
VVDLVGAVAGIEAVPVRQLDRPEQLLERVLAEEENAELQAATVTRSGVA